MKAAYIDEAAYKNEERITPPKATPEPKKVPLRSYWRELAARRARPSLYLPPEAIDEYTSTLDLADGGIEELRGLYEFTDEVAVCDFLEAHPFLTDLLVDARIKIQEYFGADVPVALDVLREPDAKNGGRLFVLIFTTLRPKEAMSRLDALDRNWWLGVLPKARGKVTIDIDYG